MSAARPPPRPPTTSSSARRCAPPSAGSAGRWPGSAPPRLAAHVISAVVERSGVDPERIDEVILGHAYRPATPGHRPRRRPRRGLPDRVTGVQIDRRCGSGLQAVIDAALQIGGGFSEVVIAGGVDVMSAAPYYTHEGRWGIRGPGLQLPTTLARGRTEAGGVHHPIPAA
ncbi:hypothetical protein [Streptomyces sp. CBG9]|uniref:thiolase family protein n=1 Tax=Streptomyces sp. CBG9 TaxID=2762622 RepID=UPI0021BD1BEC